MNDKKRDLSNKILDLIIEEVPMEAMTRGNEQDAEEYFDIVTDSVAAVLARITVAYVGCLMSMKPKLTEEEITDIEGTLHYRISRHMDFEAGVLAKNLSKKDSVDA